MSRRKAELGDIGIKIWSELTSTGPQLIGYIDNGNRTAIAAVIDTGDDADYERVIHALLEAVRE